MNVQWGWKKKIWPLKIRKSIFKSKFCHLISVILDKLLNLPKLHLFLSIHYMSSTMSDVDIDHDVDIGDHDSPRPLEGYGRNRKGKKVKVAQPCPILCNPHGLEPTTLLCPRNSPSKNTGVGSHSFPQGIFLTEGLNPSLLHCRITIWAIRKAHTSKQT